MSKLMRSEFFIFRSLLVSVVLMSVVSCQKELNYDLGGGGSTGTAVFSLVPSGSNCSDALVNGSFQVGIATSANENVTVTVNVTKTGNWAYSTGQVNGVIFAGVGNFSATGNQIITLYASGKPLTSGSFDFNLNIGATCKFTVTVSTTGGGGTSDIYYKATIGGVNYYQPVTSSNNYEAGSGLGGVDDVVFGGGINYANPPVPKGLTEMEVDKGVMHHYTSATRAQFKAFFAPGDYSYAPGSFSTGDGVVITWTDPNGEYWDTRDGRVDQTGSTFKIVSVEDAPDITGTFYVKVKMQFTCKLYNVNTGAMKQLTNGEIVVYFGMI